MSESPMTYNPPVIPDEDAEEMARRVEELKEFYNG